MAPFPLYVYVAHDLGLGDYRYLEFIFTRMEEST
jgi:hypothetical protein